MNYEYKVKIYKISSFLKTDIINLISDDKFKLLFHPKYW